MRFNFLLLIALYSVLESVSAVTPSKPVGTMMSQTTDMKQEDKEFLQQIVLARLSRQITAFKNYFFPPFNQLTEKLRKNILNKSETDETIMQIQQLANQVRFKWKGLDQFFTSPETMTLDNYDPQFLGQVKQIIGEYAADLEKNKRALTQLQTNRRFMVAQLATMRQSPNSQAIRQIDANIAAIQSKIQALYRARIQRIEKIILDEEIPNASF